MRALEIVTVIGLIILVLVTAGTTAASTVAGSLPRRARTVLQAESLVNDGTTLVLYAVAVGVAVALVVVAVRRRPEDDRLDDVLSVLTCFLAYLPAEPLHASGVVAVVTCGLTLAQISSWLGSARARAQSTGFWTVSTFLLRPSASRSADTW